MISTMYQLPAQMELMGHSALAAAVVAAAAAKKAHFVGTVQVTAVVAVALAVSQVQAVQVRLAAVLTSVFSFQMCLFRICLRQTFCSIWVPLVLAVRLVAAAPVVLVELVVREALLPLTKSAEGAEGVMVVEVVKVVEAA